MSNQDQDQNSHSNLTENAASGADLGASTLLPMLIGGVMLVIVGAVVLMYFV